jgi:hypothetical protein
MLHGTGDLYASSLLEQLTYTPKRRGSPNGKQRRE